VIDEYAGGCGSEERRWIWLTTCVSLSTGLGAVGARVPVSLALDAADKWRMSVRYVNTVIRCNSRRVR
jgi:hypothetical protein